MLLQHICDDFKQFVVVVIRDEQQPLNTWRLLPICDTPYMIPRVDKYVLRRAFYLRVIR